MTGRPNPAQVERLLAGNEWAKEHGHRRGLLSVEEVDALAAELVAVRAELAEAKQAFIGIRDSTNEMGVRLSARRAIKRIEERG